MVGYWTRLAIGGAIFAPAALFAAAGPFGAAAIEDRLEAASKAELELSDHPWATARATGRTLRLYFPSGQNGEAAAALLAQVPGVIAVVPVAIDPGEQPQVPQAQPAATPIMEEPVILLEEEAPAPDAAEICRTAINRAMNGRRLTFRSESSNLAEADIELLGVLSAAFSSCEGQSLIIEGHTDSTGAHEANMELSRQRAEAVAAYIRNSGAPVKVVASYFGETRPIASNSSEVGREANRRIDFVVPDEEMKTE